MKLPIEVQAYAVTGTVTIVKALSREDGTDVHREIELFLNPDQVDKLLMLLAAARKDMRDNLQHVTGSVD